MSSGEPAARCEAIATAGPERPALATGGLTAKVDGRLEGHAGDVTLPLNSERLQATVSRFGVFGVAVWGSGPVGDVVFEPALPSGADVVILPNRIEFAWGAGALKVTALPSLPVVMFEATGEAPVLRLRPERAAQPGFERSARLIRGVGAWRARSEWSQGELGGPGCEALERGRVILGSERSAWLAAGDHDDELESTLETLRREGVTGAMVAHAAYRERVGGVFAASDALLTSMFQACLHAALSCTKRLPDGSFAGFSAGIGYSVPPRTYFRDSYWTLQPLLPLWPELAREQLTILARGVHDDGEAPSGVMISSQAGERVWRARLAADPGLASDHSRPGEWWPDHFDSPLYFVLLAGDVASWTHDPGLIEERIGGRKVGDLIAGILHRAEASAQAGGSSLPVKPLHDRDWADNVFRSGFVTYDVGLYHGALEAAATLFERASPRQAAEYRKAAAQVRSDASERIFRADTGHFVEFQALAGGSEEHLALDSLTALRFGLASAVQAASTLAAVGRTLETRHNRGQPYGDWGVMCTYPPYRRTTRLRGKSAFAYRYHNGSDWPYLDGIYAEQLLSARDPNWRYALTRWWEYSLSRGWPTPVEYYSPPWGRGSPLNGWSAMPAAAMLLGGFALRPDRTEVRAPPWGDCDLRSVISGSGRVDIAVRGGGAAVTRT